MKNKLNLTLSLLAVALLVLVALIFGYYFGFKNGYQSIKFAIERTMPEKNDTQESSDENNNQEESKDKIYSDKNLGISFSYPSDVNIQKQSKGIALEFSNKKIEDRNAGPSEIKKQRSASASVNIYDSVYTFTGGYNDLKTYISFLGVTVDKYKKSQFGGYFWEEYDELGEGYEHNYVLEKNGKIYNINMDDLSYEAAKTDLENILKTFEVTD